MMRSLLLVLLSLLTLNACVSQRTVDGKDRPVPAINEAAAAKDRLALGLQYLQNGNFEQAKANLERARSLNPDDPGVHNGLAYYYQQVRDYGQAEQYYRSALRLEPRNGDTMNNLAVLLCTQERFSEADAMFRQAVAAPGYVKVASTYQNAARCAEQQANWRVADQYYRLALNYGANAGIFEGYADLLIRQSRYQEARQILDRRAAMPQFTAEYLWLEVQNARALRDSAREAQYGALLLNRFGQSSQAASYRKLKQTQPVN